MSDELYLTFRDLPGRKRELEPGEALFHRGDTVRRVYFVIRGAIHLVRHQASGTSLVIQRAGAGQIIAEASLFATKYHCHAVAMLPTAVWSVAKSELLSHISGDPNIGLTFVKALAHELQHSRFQVEVLSMKTVAARLDAWIEWNGGLPPKGEWVSLAAELAVSPEALYREISRRRA
ncbi:Crp/Fnr family transcriptional regulator [Bradyrhizobium viridifuturi]|uniref:Crp/Fnr family transcriptional regulator n=1 Tax=Bradyrhizobium viridifuturi TaxID=1654716 RepID=UPI00067EF777|nr:Crp/Fnr family transcriptional regulator [Bradyrhizobium viridifuturi]